MAGLSLRVRTELGGEPLLQGSVKVFRISCQLGGDLEEDTELAGGTTHPFWPGNASGPPQGELESVAGERNVSNTLLSRLPPSPNPG